MSEETQDRYDKTQAELERPAQKKRGFGAWAHAKYEEVKATQDARRAERAQVNAVEENARREGRIAGAREKGLAKGREQAKYGTGVTGSIRKAMAPKTATVRTVTGKGRRRRVTTRETPVKGGGGILGAVGGFGANMTDSMEGAYGFGGGGSKRKESDSFGGVGGGLESAFDLGGGKKKKAKDPFAF